MEQVDAKRVLNQAKGTVSDVTDAAEHTVRDATNEADRRVRELGSFIREQREHAKLSGRNLARRAGVSNPYLSQIERGLRKPSAEILQSIAGALRISAETLYVKAGILEEREGDLTAAIMADRSLTETQRRALLEVYRSFTAAAEPSQDDPAGSTTSDGAIPDDARPDDVPPPGTSAAAS